MTTESYTAPGWDVLLTNTGGLDNTLGADGLKTLENAVDNVLGDVINGMAAIGELQWRASETGEVSSDVVFSTGCLITRLAELVQALHTMGSNAKYWQHKIEMGLPATLRTEAAA